jgi:two-component system chemotaxis response regulator CheY
MENKMASTVMIVDDSQMVRQQVERALTGAGFATVEACDGADALAKLSNGLSLIVLDVNMPNMGGLEFLQTLRTRSEYSALPVVMLTTEGQPQLMKQAKELGAKGWIVKPFKPELLLAAVKKLTHAV